MFNHCLFKRGFNSTLHSTCITLYPLMLLLSLMLFFCGGVFQLSFFSLNPILSSIVLKNISTHTNILKHSVKGCEEHNCIEILANQTPGAGSYYINKRQCIEEEARFAFVRMCPHAQKNADNIANRKSILSMSAIAQKQKKKHKNVIKPHTFDVT